jgi:hypothetical protein
MSPGQAKSPHFQNGTLFYKMLAMAPPPRTRTINGEGRKAFPHHSPKANHSPLAFFPCGCEGSGGSCGLRGWPCHPRPGRVSFSPEGSSLAVGRGLWAKFNRRPIFCPYNSCSYARTNQAVGCEHCLREGNTQPREESWPRPLRHEAARLPEIAQRVEAFKRGT